MANKKNRVMSDQEIESWNRLCDYVKRHILRYDDNQLFPSYMALKLKGLQRGQYVANNNQTAKANYTYDVIYLAFATNRKFIVDYIDTHTVNDEKHLVNLIIKLVQGFLNDAYKTLKNAEAQKDFIARQTFENQYNEPTEYKTDSKSNKTLEKLW